MRPTQELIAEAAKRGIRPGAKVIGNFNRLERIVPDYPDWSQEREELYVDGMLYWRKGEWCVELISPAPSEEGLKEGDAVECGPAMRAAIVELAKELGMDTGGGDPTDEEVFAMYVNYQQTIVAVSRDADYHPGKQPKYHAPETFIAKMRVAAAKPKPIKIGNDVVEFRIGGIKVGCTTIDNATVRAIASKLID